MLMPWLRSAPFLVPASMRVLPPRPLCDVPPTVVMASASTATRPPLPVTATRPPLTPEPALRSALPPFWLASVVEPAVSVVAPAFAPLAAPEATRTPPELPPIECPVTNDMLPTLAPTFAPVEMERVPEVCAGACASADCIVTVPVVVNEFPLVTCILPPEPLTPAPAFT